MAGILTEMAGKKFGRLTVIRRNGTKNKCAAWLCSCECGRTTTIDGSLLRRGNVRSCGCLADETWPPSRITHNGSRSPEYKVWIAMRRRCHTKTDDHYDEYGGRGISVCARWRHSFENFLADMGKRPSAKHSLDRFPDNDGNYEPSNCRWATDAEQQRNRRISVYLTHKGERRLLVEWAERLKMSPFVLYERLKRGWSHSRVIETPVKKSAKKAEA